MTSVERVLMGVQTGIFGDGMFGDRPERDLPGVLDEARDAGYDGVEVMGNLLREPPAVREGCRRRGLRVLGLHLFWWELADLDVATVAAELGAERLIVSCLPITEPAHVEPVAERLRAVAADLTPTGLPLLVHNHAPEGRVLADGRTPLEALAAMLPAAELGFVIDLYWAAVAGTLRRTIERIGPRCDYYHVKDGSVAEPKSRVPYDLGTGEVDLIGAWELLRRRPLAVATVERGAPPVDPAASLRHDARFVRGLSAERP